MANDPFLRMLGLARRAGKLAFGDELVREMCLDKKARCVFAAADAGASTAKKAAFYAERANVPFVPLPHGKDELGAAIGKNGCAVCAVSDIGMVSSAMNKLASEHEQYAALAAQLAEKNARIQSRRGKKKPKDRERAPQAQPAAAEMPAARPVHRAGRRTDGKPRFTGERRTDGKPRFTGERRTDGKPRFTGDRRINGTPRLANGQRAQNSTRKPSRNSRAPRAHKIENQRSR